MSNHRAAFILTGGGLLTLAILGFTAREFQLGLFAARLAAWSPIIAYGTCASAAMLGVLLLVFAPSSRRVERRVRLDRPDAQNPVMARPSTRAGIPTTSGMAAGSDPAASSTPTDSVHSSNGGTNGAARPQAAATARPAAHATAAPGWAHPNDARHVTSGSAPTKVAPERPPAAKPGPDAEETSSLRTRLAEIDRQANHAKVRYGLGQLSPNGYRAVLEKLNEARAEIEETLLGDLHV